jgi:hypothetical protein
MGVPYSYADGAWACAEAANTISTAPCSWRSFECSLSCSCSLSLEVECCVSMYVCICVFIVHVRCSSCRSYLFDYVCMYAFTYVRMRSHMHVCTHACMHFLCVCVLMYAYTCYVIAEIDVCMYMCLCVYVFMCAHTCWSFTKRWSSATKITIIIVWFTERTNACIRVCVRVCMRVRVCMFMRVRVCM